MPRPKNVANRGQASVEYLVVAAGVVIALVVLSVAGRNACLEGMALTPSAGGCQGLEAAVGSVLQQTVEDVTYLINLPF